MEFRRISEMDGLSNPNVRDFFKDSMGFLWIATSDGLNRYDGTEFKIYRNQIDNPESLSDNSINTIFEDSHRLLWVGTEAGLNYLDLKTNKVQRFVKDPSIAGAISGDRIRHILEDKSGDLWIAFDNGAGLDKWDREANKFINYDLFELFPPTEYGVFYQAIRDMAIDPINDNILWLGTTGGLLSFDMNSKQFTKHPHPILWEKSRNVSVWSIGWEKDHLLRVGFFGIGTDVFNTNDLSWKESYSPPEAKIRVYDMIKKSPSEFWVAVREKGLGILNTETNNIQFIHSEINDYKTPFPGFTSTVYTDSDKLWVGGRYGISYLDPSRNLFKVESVEAELNRFGRITEVAGSGDILFLATLSGGEVIRMNRKKNQTQIVYSENEPFHVTCLREVQDKVYFFIKGRTALYQYDKGTSSVEILPMQGDSSLYKGQFIANDFVSINDKEALLSTEYHGTLKINLIDASTSIFLGEDKKPLTLSTNRLIEPMQDGTFWVGCPKGIAIYNPVEDAFSFLIPQYLKKEKNKRVTSVRNHSLGTFIGTTSGLIFMEDGVEKLITTTNSDILGNEIFQIEIDDQENVWVRTRRGLSRIDPKTLEILNYDLSDGLDLSGRFGHLANGEFFVCNKGGFSLFHPDSLTRHTNAPETYFTSFELLGRSDNMREVEFGQPIALGYKENLFSISFASPFFTNSHKMKFAYKMDGFSTDWIPTSSRTINFSNLNSGEYTFAARTMNADGVWGPAKTQTIIIEPPFWRTWWFTLLCGLALLGIIYALFQYRVNLVRREQEQEARIFQIEALQKRLFDMNLNPYEKQLNVQKLNDILKDPLTEREFEILDLSLQEKSNSQIAEQLYISKSTVKFHLRNTYKKLGVGNRREALAYINKTS